MAVFIFHHLLLLSLSLPLLSSALSASQSLKLHNGYSLSSASLTLSLSSALWNRSGTFLAPPDSAFSLHRRRPSLSLLLSHTLHQRLSSLDLSRLPHRPLATWQPHRCLTPSFKIVHPDIYVDDDLAVHGIDRLADDLAVRCFASNPTAEIKSQFLDHAGRILRRKGFGVVSAALAAKKLDLLNLDEATVFATSDKILFSEANGFRYDFLRHVVPRRYRLAEIRRLSGIATIDPEKPITVGSESGYSEIYHNRWIVVIGIPRIFDEESPSLFPSPAPESGGVYGEEDVAEEWRPASEERRCTATDYLFCPVKEKETDYGERSEPLISEKMVESAPSHQMNKEMESEPLDGRVLKESTVEMVRRKMSSVGENSEGGPKIVQFQVADDLFYYT